ncbi:hypothetical protein [Streptomyces sp. NPDC054849]
MAATTSTPLLWAYEEGGQGDGQNPNFYTVPARQWAAAKTITLPKNFFLKGWIQVLNPSEIATWLVLRMMSQWAPQKHRTSGVFLTTRPRTELFGLRDDAWEDGCQRVLEFGLIRHAEPPEADGAAEGLLKILFSQPTRVRQRYEPRFWQMTDAGLARDAAQKLDRELILRQQRLDTAADSPSQTRTAISERYHHGLRHVQDQLTT